MAMGIDFPDAHLLASAPLARTPLWASDRALKFVASELKLAYGKVHYIINSAKPYRL